jgi:hypothetical protein
VKSVIIIFSVLFVFAVSSVSFAVEEKEAKPVIPSEVSSLPGVAKARQITGDVTAVNTSAMAITVTKKMKHKVVETAVTINDKTNIKMGKEKRTLADVKVGDKVIVTYKGLDGKNVAQSITIKPATTAPEEKKIEKKGNPAEKK